MTIITAIVRDETLAAIVTLAIVAALADFACGVIAALRAGTFNFRELAQFVGTHLLARVVPIAAVAFVASALSAALAGIHNAPAVLVAAPDAAWAAAWAAVIAYVLETVSSLTDSLGTIRSGVPKPS